MSSASPLPWAAMAPSGSSPPCALLTALVGVNYMAICRHYPDGGGVYASVRHRSEIISIVGAFLLIADYIVTAAISALSSTPCAVRRELIRKLAG